MKTRVPLATTTSQLRRRVAATTTAVALGAAALMAPTGATAEPTAVQAAPTGSPCPAAYPQGDLVKGQHVTGLTVSEGTVPEEIEGEFVGTLEDGIFPGVDMLIFKITGSEVTDAAGDVDRGIWAGMSGSPLYTDDGRLVGSVSYGLSYSPSDYAGVTPAAAIYKLKKYDTESAARKAPIGSSIARLMRADGASARQTSEGMARLPMPTSINSPLPMSRIKKYARKTGYTGHTFRRSTGAAKPSSTKIPVVAGGNVGMTDSYGSTTFGSVGTATAVCGSKVYAYGHPAAFSGPSTATMHGADALYIEKDNYDGSFKVANLGAPVGAFTQDRLTGILGTVGAPPKSTVLTSRTSATNGNQRSSKSWVTTPDALAFAGLNQVASDVYSTFDGWRGGQSTVWRKIVVERKNGKTLTYSRTDKASNEYDITDDASYSVAGDIDNILYNGIEPVTIKSVTTSTKLAEGYRAYKVAKVQVKRKGQWRTMTKRSTITTKVGARLRIRLTVAPKSGSIGSTKVINTHLFVPRGTRGKTGALDINGGSYEDEYYEDDYYRSAPSARSTDKLAAYLRSMARAPHPDDVLVDLSIGRGRTEKSRSVTKKAPGIVFGSKSVAVKVARK